MDRVGPTDHSFDSEFPNRFYRPWSSLLEAHAMYLKYRHFFYQSSVLNTLSKESLGCDGLHKTNFSSLCGPASSVMVYPSQIEHK